MANRFHKLKNNQSDFPIVENVDVFKYDNDFDYSRYDYTQMELQICTVPWDVGEAHVGQRTISGIGNVVYFGSKAERDKWFADIPESECYRFETKFKELHREQIIDVPIPYDMCAKYNYLVVRYNLFANDGSPVAYEGEDGKRDWFWFIREVEFKAPNTTRLHLLDDAFQTWIYDVNVTSMILERGHAPMFSTRAGKFLENPIQNNEFLLTEDVNFGGTDIVKHTDALVLNSGDMLACVATTANPRGNYGTKADDTWRTPASAYYMNNGVPSVYVFGMAPDDLNTFLTNITSSTPQFKQTVQGVFFASRQLVKLGTAFDFGGVTCYGLSANRVTLDLTELDKSLFGYDIRYSDMAKLYTYPYAHIEVVDENGNVDEIRIEDTTGQLDVSASMSLAYPFVNLEAHILGAGGGNRRNVTFRNVTERTFAIQGTWYETLHEWKVPTFAVVLDASREYDYSTHFDRKQAVTAYTNAYNSSIASATTARTNANASATTAQTNAINSADTARDNAIRAANTAKTNADATADTMKANADRSADTTVANARLQTTANTASTNAGNTMASADTQAGQTLNTNLTNNSIDYTNASKNNDIDMQYATAACSQASNAISAATSIGMALATPTPLAAAGAVSAAINGIGQAAVIQQSTENGVNYTEAQAAASNQNNRSNAIDTNITAYEKNQNAITASNTRLDAANALTTGSAANEAATVKANASANQSTMKANATRDQSTATTNANATYDTAETNANNTYTTDTGNATRSYNTAVANAGRTRDTAQQAIINATKQAALRSPFVFGNYADGDSAVTKPIALFSNVVTQSKAAIALAGDEFARYGYMLDRQWDFDGNWNIGKYFTYWKLRDFWVSGLNVPDLYMDKLRFFLFGGVTIWRKPEYIGKIDLYDNF